MSQIINFFAGANSGNGFQNLFGEITDISRTYDFMILKGGAGVGKNTFMRLIGQSMEKAGLDIEYLWCSGDPDSLDGVVIPALRCAVADGTAPHVLEPQFPAAVDRYVNLGRFYDITAAKIDAEQVKTYTHIYQDAYKRAYHALKAARQMELERDVSFDQERGEKRLRGIILRELRRKGTEEGRTVRRFLGSITHKGYVWRFDTVDALCPRVYEFVDSFNFVGSLLASLHKTAVNNGWNTIACMSPEDTSCMEHLLIPSLGLAFISTRSEMEYTKTPYRRIRLDALTKTPNKSRLRFTNRMISLLREEGVRALHEAHEAHDKLEAVYNPYVDFEGVRALATLETGRLLSFRYAHVE